MDASVPPDCDPPCALGETCRAGVCVADGEDGDMDGVEAAVDCDDTDPSIGSTGERLCASECGEGLTSCTDGVWTECNAPAECECEAGSPPRTVDCGFCGTQRQVCTDGRWTNDGACTSPGECVPGQVEMGGACGTCGTLRRTCGSDCAWGDWTCTGGGGECTPGATESDTQPCGTCGTGTQTRTRTCTSSCTWGPWSAYSTCTGGGACAPGAMRYGCDQNSSGAATMCGVEICTSSCTWGACQLAPGAECMSGRGTNYQCCTPTGGGSGWRFCNASTCTWYPCASHSC